MYKVIITRGDFLSPKEFIKKYSTKDIKAVVENVEFEGTDEVHTSGYTLRDLTGRHFTEIYKELKTIYIEEDLRGECMGVYLQSDEGFKNEVFTEDDFYFWHV